MKRKIIVVLVLICIFIGSGLLFYIGIDEDYREEVWTARVLYYKSDYLSAYNFIKDYSPHFFDRRFFKKVTILGTAERSYIKFHQTVEETTIISSNIQTSLEELINSITICIENKDEAVKLGIENKLNKIKEKSLEDMELYFKANEQDISQFINLDEEEKKAKIDKLVEVRKSSIKEFVETKKTMEANKAENQGKTKIELAKLEQEKIINPLKIEDEELIFRGNYMYYSGYIKNVGEKTYYYTKIKATYYDNNNNVIDTDWTYAVGSEGLAPNDRKSFQIMTVYNKSVTQGSLSILDYEK